VTPATFRHALDTALLFPTSDGGAGLSLAMEENWRPSLFWRAAVRRGAGRGVVGGRREDAVRLARGLLGMGARAESDGAAPTLASSAASGAEPASSPYAVQVGTDPRETVYPEPGGGVRAHFAHIAALRERVQALRASAIARREATPPSSSSSSSSSPFAAEIPTATDGEVAASSGSDAADGDAGAAASAAAAMGPVIVPLSLRRDPRTLGLSALSNLPSPGDGDGDGNSDALDGGASGVGSPAAVPGGPEASPSALLLARVTAAREALEQHRARLNEELEPLEQLLRHTWETVPLVGLNLLPRRVREPIRDWALGPGAAAVEAFRFAEGSSEATAGIAERFASIVSADADAKDTCEMSVLGTYILYFIYIF
jgi:hypothetical protein